MAAAGVSIARTIVHPRRLISPFLCPRKPTSLFVRLPHSHLQIRKKNSNPTVTFAALEDKKPTNRRPPSTGPRDDHQTSTAAAVMTTLGITSTAAAVAVYSRFAARQIMAAADDQVIMMPNYVEMFGTFALCVVAAVAMEFWARWAHRNLWHASLWHVHESHHKPQRGRFELNDAFSVIHGVAALALISYGFFHEGLVSCLCFGAGVGIAVFGVAYMIVHDGLAHRRFPVGPVADVAFLRRLASVHLIHHHSDKFNGVPYGLFLGPQELEQEVGGLEELEKTNY